jgi:hypothetical protein
MQPTNAVKFSFPDLPFASRVADAAAALGADRAFAFDPGLFAVA